MIRETTQLIRSTTANKRLNTEDTPLQHRRVFACAPSTTADHYYYDIYPIPNQKNTPPSCKSVCTPPPPSQIFATPIHHRERVPPAPETEKPMISTPDSNTPTKRHGDTHPAKSGLN